MDTLGGLQVIDLSYGIAGPIVGAFFADFGAEVIKVEPPEGDPARAEPGFTAWNRGKQSVTVDPADPVRQRWLASLLGGADVCVVSSEATLAAHGLDRWLASGALGPKFERLLLGALGLSWMLDEERMDGRVENLIRPDNIAWANELTAKAFLEKDRDEWLTIMGDLGIPCGALGDRQDWLDHPQVRAFRKLAATSDVVVTALRPGVAAKLGIDHETLANDNQGLVTVSLSAYGEGGPLSHLPGVDMVIQGLSGMMRAQGGDSAPVASTIAIIDVTTAAMIALSAVLALLHRERDGAGKGQRAWVSLAGTAAYLQTGEIVRYAGRRPAGVGGRDFLGTDPFDRYYPAGDGWVRLHAPQPVTAPELRAAGLMVAPGAFAADPAAALTAALARRVSEVVRDPQLVVSEFVHVRPSAAGVVYVTPGRLASFSRTPRFGPLRSPGVGEHSRAALRSAGLTEEEVTALVAANVVIDGDQMPQGLATAYR